MTERLFFSWTLLRCPDFSYPVSFWAAFVYLPSDWFCGFCPIYGATSAGWKADCASQSRLRARAASVWRQGWYRLSLTRSLLHRPESSRRRLAKCVLICSSFASCSVSIAPRSPPIHQHHQSDYWFHFNIPFWIQIGYVSGFWLVFPLQVVLVVLFPLDHLRQSRRNYYFSSSELGWRWGSLW